MTTWQSLNKENQEMVDKFTRLAIIQSKEVENAFRCVSRAAFVSKELFSEAFTDAPIRGSPHLHMSAPHIYATILEDLELEPGMSFLNIGSGTGYFSCLIGYLIKSHGINHGIELHEDLVEFSHERVKDFLANGPSDVSEVCPPLLIPGNGFCLDPTQMKYDRLYCGGACPQGTVTFFLQFLKVGGFLVAPVGTKLIKLERVSHQEGVKTVLSDVCFTPLTRLDNSEKSKLKTGLIPFVCFPIKTRKKKPKKMIFPSVNFPVSSSQAKRKLARLRAIQHALDSLANDNSIPPAFCYVPEQNQINNYKHYKKILECKGVMNQFNNSTNETSATASNIASSEGVNSPFLTALRQSQTSRSSDGSSAHLMTIQEFLMAASDSQELLDQLGNSPNASMSQLRTSLRDQGNGFTGPRLSSTQSSPHSGSTESLTGTISSLLHQREVNNTLSTSTSTKGAIKKEIIEYSDHDYDVNGKVSKDIWTHLCSDKLWENVLECYYSVCTTTAERKDKCFQLKGIEIVQPNLNKFPDTLVFKTSKKSDQSEKSQNSCMTKKRDTEIEKVAPQSSNNRTEGIIFKDVETLLNELVGKVSDAVDSTMKNAEELVNPSECRIENTTPPSCSVRKKETMVSKKVKSKQYVDVKTDIRTAERLSTVANTKWTKKHDLNLISYLILLSKSGENQAMRCNIPKELTPEMFDQSKLIKFPSLSSIDSSLLCSRAIGLQRVVKVLDSVLDVLVGPSVKRDQFDNPFKIKYPLVSFSDLSFQPSDSQLNVVEAQNEKPITAPNDEESEEVIYQEAASPEDEELLKEVESMIAFELGNVHQQQLILVKKVRLIDSIDEQFKEQVKLLNQQVDLIDEQQRLLVDVHLEGGSDRQLASSQQLITERKQQRQALLTKRDRINGERENQLLEKKEILSMLEQLLTLDSRLRNELKSLKKKGMGYLRGTSNDLSNFSKFVQKADTILKRLRVSSTKIRSQSEGQTQEKLKEKKDTAPLLSNRYHPETILPRCRFLLPLSKKRHNFVKEMLRSTERSAPSSGMPIISVDRRVPVNERHKHGEPSTVFVQIHSSLKNKDLHYRWSKKAYSQWWEVKFHGEGIIDQGGGFRDSLTEMSEELCPTSPDCDACLPLFIRTPNQRTRMGDFLDCYTLNPNCKQFPLYKWLGQLFGACFRTGETVPLALPPFIWKLLVGEEVTWKDDYLQIDEAAVKNIDGLDNLEDDAYKALNIEQTYSTNLSDQTELDLLPNGSEITVQCKDRAKYSTMVRKARMMESAKQVQALRDGILTVLPEPVLSCLTWNRLERGVCGSPTISIAELKANCRYGDRLSQSSQSVVHMWSALSSFTDDERSRFLRFITGRKRLPSPFIVFRSSSEGGSNSTLPSASTCGSNLFLPEYTNAEIAKEKLRYAIYNCVAIDTDTSPW